MTHDNKAENEDARAIVRRWEPKLLGPYKTEYVDSWGYRIADALKLLLEVYDQSDGTEPNHATRMRIADLVLEYRIRSEKRRLDQARFRSLRAAVAERQCEAPGCSEIIPAGTHARQRFCSGRCRLAAHRAKSKTKR
ncbi:hypothetical protein [Salipiger thiooxidans]|uniref:hypothetical protein n=1 Tax=Salipiger thiooxidans TaxID=282683 RepID=UPI001CD66A9B|nr:hypothetical protein [Salipiger thiooxidans]MCA0850000.1 hypothetical protein [Salipiger thiooxidans]